MQTAVTGENLKSEHKSFQKVCPSTFLGKAENVLKDCKYKRRNNQINFLWIASHVIWENIRRFYPSFRNDPPYTRGTPWHHLTGDITCRKIRFFSVLLEIFPSFQSYEVMCFFTCSLAFCNKGQLGQACFFQSWFTYLRSSVSLGWLGLTGFTHTARQTLSVRQD